MRIFTGRGGLMEACLIQTLRRAMAEGERTQLVVVPKQLTLQTERTLLSALGLRGSFALQVCSPQRLCGRVFEAAGAPEGVRVDEQGRTMLVRQAARQADARLKLYRGAAARRGFAERCARQLEVIRQAGLSPRELERCAGEAEGALRLKLNDLAAILEAYEALLEGRFQDGETEFRAAAARAGDAAFLKQSCVYFYGFDMTPPTLHELMAAVGAACHSACVFLPLENDPQARDFDAFLPMQGCFERLYRAAERAGARPERVFVEAEGKASAARVIVSAPPQEEELRRLNRELFAFPVEAADRPPRHIQAVTLRNPLEECRFAAALCRRLAMVNGWRWNDMLILCRDIDGYRQPLKEAFADYGVPLFLSSSRAASRHPLAECLNAALRLAEPKPRLEDALALLHTGCMPLERQEADRLANFAVRYGLKPWALLRPLKRGSEAEREALEPIRERFAAPINALKRRVSRAESLKRQLEALFDFLTDIRAADALTVRLNALAEAGLREQAGEEGQVWNRIIAAMDQMAGLLGEAPLPAEELRRVLTEALEAAIIKPLPQSSDAVYAQTTDRITAQNARALLILGETDRASLASDGLLNPSQTQALKRMTRAWLGSDDAELSRMRRFYIKSAVERAGEYLCVSCPLSGLDGSAQRPGALFELLRGVFPGLTARGGVTDDESLQWMLRAGAGAAVAHGARALSAMGEGEPLRPWDAAALAGLCDLAGGGDEAARGALARLRMALDYQDSVERLSPRTARALYGALNRQSITRLESYAACPFAYFTQYGLAPERLEPYRLTVQDEGEFFHEAVRAFLSRSMDDLNALAEEEARARMAVIADELLDALAEAGPLGDSAVTLAERRRLKATAQTCAAVLAEHMRGSRFAPAALESDFGVEDGPARLIVDADSGACTLEGRIDRVDAFDEAGYLRVIDYKRGGRSLNLDGVYHGLSLQLPIYLAAAMRKRGERSAGVYYFSLDEGILALQSTDPNEVERERRKSFRLMGLAPDDLSLLQAQSPRFEEVLNVSVNKGGGLKKGSLVTDAHGFQALMDRALTMAGRHLDGIRSGRAEIAPARFRQSNPCAYCRWRAICRFDERVDGRRARRFPTLRADQVLEKLKLEDERGTGE